MRYMARAFRPLSLMGLVLLAGIPARAQNVTAEPICFSVRNTAPYMVFGTLATDLYTRDDGMRARHRSNFRLDTGQRDEFCASGPFFPGGKLELTLRSLVPLFSCRTRVDQGEILVKGMLKQDGTTQTWAECYE
ncbi:MAG: hypothetical protein EOM26_00500 [Alphaproteobacteria bacterium]|nr:hypothetical protein [Alphaproteobacteria bacterium]